MRSGRGGILSPVMLQEVYASTGRFAAKMLIDPGASIGIETVQVTMRDSDGRPMDYTFKRWGTKLNLEFDVTDSTPDGMSVIEVRMTGKRHESTERFTLWIIK